MARMVRKSQASVRWASFVTLGGLVLLTWWAVGAVRLARVPSGSMEPTLLPGDLLLMRIDAYRHRLPAHGDLVIFRDPTDNGGLMVKRVLGLPGDSVFVRGGVVWVNDKVQEEPYVKRPYLSAEIERTLLQDDQLWVMGDNRTNSEDSRDFGAIERKDLVGRAAAVIWPAARRQPLPRGVLEKGTRSRGGR